MPRPKYQKRKTSNRIEVLIADDTLSMLEEMSHDFGGNLSMAVRKILEAEERKWLWRRRNGRRQSKRS